MKTLLVINLLSPLAFLASISAEEDDSSPAFTNDRVFSTKDLPRGDGMAVVTLRSESEFDLSNVTRMPEFTGFLDKKALFWVFIGDRVVLISHQPTHGRRTKR